jgi:hypothetical protein
MNFSYDKVPFGVFAKNKLDNSLIYEDEILKISFKIKETLVLSRDIDLFVSFSITTTLN